MDHQSRYTRRDKSLVVRTTTRSDEIHRRSSTEEDERARSRWRSKEGGGKVGRDPHKKKTSLSILRAGFGSIFHFFNLKAKKILNGVGERVSIFRKKQKETQETIHATDRKLLISIIVLRGRIRC